MVIQSFSILILLLTMIPASLSWAGPVSRNCLQKHMQDAIELNETRAPIYTQASQGASQKISEVLIQWEHRLARKSLIADTWARAYQRVGIPVLCQDLEDMKYSPSLPPYFDSRIAPDAEDFVNLVIEDLQRELLAALDISYEEVQRRAGHYLRILAQEKKLNCMTRHFLESIYKFAESSPGYLAHPNAKRFRSLNFFLRHTIKNQIKDLDLTHELDIMALPVQKKGVGILCLDVPTIVDHF